MAKRTALCLGGGGSRGIFQYGMISRLWEIGERPQIVLGTSVGSLNGAGVALGDMGLMQEIWMNVKNKDVRTLAPWQLFNKQASLYNFDPLLKSLRRVIDADKLRASQTLFYATCTSLETNNAVRYRLSGDGCHPDPIAALHASCSPPVLVPPCAGALYDGGITDNFNVGFAMALGAERIIMLHPSLPNKWRINHVVDAIEAVIAIPMWSQYQREIDGIRDIPAERRPELIAIDPSRPAPFGMFDFDFKGLDRAALIQEGYDCAKKAFP